MTGIGGTVDNSYSEQAVVVFHGSANLLYGYDLEIRIMPDDEDLAGFASLLGRDILEHWVMLYAPPVNELTMQVQSADYQIPTEDTPGHQR